VSDARLSPERESELVVAAEGGDRAACRQLVDHYLPAIAGIARHFGTAAVERTELMQEGVAGLLFAAKRYDSRLRTPFWAYASFWVRKAMQELIAEVSGPVSLSDHAARGLARIRAARRDHLLASGAEPTNAELAAETGLNPTQLDSLLAIERPARGYQESATAEEGGTVTFEELIADPAAEQEYERVLLEMEVRDLAGRLDERERTVLWSHYGLGRPPETLNEIGSDLGLTAERIRQIEVTALEKLRDAAAAPSEAGGAAS
jgi:RNA polymerase sigma factor (sigma-70 family)